MVPNSLEETAPFTGAPALPMKTALLRPGKTQKPREYDVCGTRCRPWIIENAAEPVSDRDRQSPSREAAGGTGILFGVPRAVFCECAGRAVESPGRQTVGGT